MEPASLTQEPMPLPEKLRPTQVKVIEHFIGFITLVAQICTGYGKTKAAAGAFAQLIWRGRCDRMLCVVPRVGQLRNAAEELPSELLTFGIETQSVIVGENQVQALEGHLRRKPPILCYVVTIQSLLTGRTMATVQTLMQTGGWFVFFDEHHHYGMYNEVESDWANAISCLRDASAAWLAMSATARRFDGNDFFGKPEIIQRYDDAAERDYVKHLDLHSYVYRIDAVTVDGRTIEFTTEELAEKAGGSSPDAIDAYITQRQMRFSPKYISPLVMFPCDRLIDLRARGIRAQMLVQAMSCAHAECVVEQMRERLPANITIDWVGTGPNGREARPGLTSNREVLDRFCPPKDKGTSQRPWTLDILVNVGIAGEGMDSIDVCEVVFLTPANRTISNLQVIGRGARLMKVSRGMKQPRCHINVDSGSTMARYLNNSIERIFDENVIENEPYECAFEGCDVLITTGRFCEAHQPDSELEEYEPLPEKLGYAIVDMELEEIRGMPMFRETLKALRSVKTDPVRTDDELAAVAEKAVLDYVNRSNNISAIIAQERESLTSSVGKVAGLIVRKLYEIHGRRGVPGGVPGGLCYLMNARKSRELGAVKDLDEESLDQHYQWVRKIEQAVLENGIHGVPPWLRAACSGASIENLRRLTQSWPRYR